MDIRDTLSGMVGSVCLVYSGLPFDTVKLRLQTDTGNRDDRKQKADSKPSTSTGSLSSHAVPQTAKKQEYRGIVDCVKHMLKHEGLRSFWKGAIPALSSGLIENAVVFTSNGVLRRVFANGKSEEELPLIQHAIIGGLSGVISGTAICPAEVVKVKLQYQRSSTAGKKYTGPIHCLLSILKDRGPKGLFAGLTPLLMRDVPFNTLFFGTYRTYCAGFKYMNGRQDQSELSAVEVFLAGGFAGMTAWSIVFPFDIVKSRMQTGMSMDAHGNLVPSAQQSSVTEVASQVYREGGLRKFYRGWTPAVLRAFPANAALFLGCELSYRFFTFIQGS